jgi:hypothetical protein
MLQIQHQVFLQQPYCNNRIHTTVAAAVGAAAAIGLLLPVYKCEQTAHKLHIHCTQMLLACGCTCDMACTCHVQLKICILTPTARVPGMLLLLLLLQATN